jgi:hypothetical protein
MKRAVAALISIGFASAALAQAPEQPKNEPKGRPALNLRLEDAPASSQPRITFGRHDATGKQDTADTGLPDLGGKPSEAFNRPINPDSSGSPIPKPMEPSNNYDRR